MSFDPSLCMLSYHDGNWLFVLPNQCVGRSCLWNVYDAPFYHEMPSEFNHPLSYTCDNQLYNLNWTDPDATLNRYSCICGGGIIDTTITTKNGPRTCKG